MRGSEEKKMVCVWGRGVFTREIATLDIQDIANHINTSRKSNELCANIHMTRADPPPPSVFLFVPILFHINY